MNRLVVGLTIKIISLLLPHGSCRRVAAQPSGGLSFSMRLSPSRLHSRRTPFTLPIDDDVTGQERVNKADLLSAIIAHGEFV